jgi:hypothetical protein
LHLLFEVGMASPGGQFLSPASRLELYGELGVLECTEVGCLPVNYCLSSRALGWARHVIKIAGHGKAL